MFLLLSTLFAFAGLADAAGMYRFPMLYGRDPVMDKIKNDADTAVELARRVAEKMAEPRYREVSHEPPVQMPLTNVRTNLSMVVADLQNVVGELERALYRHPSMANSSQELSMFDHFNEAAKHSAEELNYVGIVLSLFNEHIGMPRGQHPIRFDPQPIRDALNDPMFTEHFHAHKAHALVQMLEHVQQMPASQPGPPQYHDLEKSLKVARYLEKMAQRAVGKYEAGVAGMGNECSVYVGLACPQLLEFVRIYAGELKTNIEAMQKYQQERETGPGGPIVGPPGGPMGPHHHHHPGMPFPGGPAGALGGPGAFPHDPHHHGPHPHPPHMHPHPHPYK